MKVKLGSYITKLMTTIIDFKEDSFVRCLAVDELRRLNVNIEEFLRKNELNSNKDESKEEVDKQLLQEDKKNVKDK